MKLCPDCAVEPGTPHIDGCDVARCTVCGFQWLSCDEHGDSAAGWGEIWAGRWPGDVEIEEGLADDHNDLTMRAMTGLLEWDGERWQLPAA